MDSTGPKMELPNVGLVLSTSAPDHPMRVCFVDPNGALRFCRCKSVCGYERQQAACTSE